MLIPLTEPTTPLRSIRTLCHTPNNARLNRSRLSTIHLPPHELYGVLSEISLRKGHFQRKRYQVNKNYASSFKRFSRPLPCRQTSVSTSSSPGRPLDSHLTVRRRRRSSSGMTYESGYVENISKDFLRTVSRAIVRENGAQGDTNSAPAMTTTRLSSGSFAGSMESSVNTNPDLSRQFDQSLPLPSSNLLRTPNVNVRSVDPRNLRVRQEYDFMKYLDHAAEGNGNVFQKDYTSVFETEASTPRSRQEPVFHSDSGAEYHEIRADFERAILQSRQAISALGSKTPEGKSKSVMGANSDDESYHCRLLMEYDDQQACLNIKSRKLGTGTKNFLSRSIADSPFFLKKLPVDHSSKTLSTILTNASMASTPQQALRDYSDVVTPPNPELRKHVPINNPIQRDNKDKEKSRSNSAKIETVVTTEDGEDR